MRDVDWHTIATSLDYLSIPIPLTVLRSWESYEVDERGVRFCCKTLAGQARESHPRRASSSRQCAYVDFRVDVVMPDVLRVRMAPNGIQEHSTEMLGGRVVMGGDFSDGCSFDVVAKDNCVVLMTERLRVEFQRVPWQMRVYERSSALPFYSQRIDDRAYGPAYEMAPIGFWETSDGQVAVHEAIVAKPGEAFYGFGERFTPLDKRGQSFVSWAVDCGNVTSKRSYKGIPFFMSSEGYGLFIHTSAPISYDVGSASSISCAFDVLDAQLDYFLIYGPKFRHILRRYADLTGYAPVPPKWSFGFWISRCGYKSQQEVEEIVRQMRVRDFPCDVISLDPWWMGDGPWCSYQWDEQAFPKPQAMINNLKAQGVRTCLWVTPYVAPGSEAYAEGQAGDYFIKKADGNLSPVVESFAGVDLGAVDFTNPQACVWFQKKLERLLDMGVAVFKTDFGEQAPVDALYADGRTGIEMHNLYPLLYNATVFELTQRKFGRGLTWGRSGYAGSQRYPVQWGGDSYASFDQMLGQLWGLLSYGMSGVPFCSHDVGGFDYPPSAFDEAMSGEAATSIQNILEWGEVYGASLVEAGQKYDAEVYVRWLQFGVFSSHLRAHGKQAREPWAYGPEAEKIARYYLELRYRLLPYIYTEAVKSSASGLPMVRPLVLMFQDDPNTSHVDLEYMFGDSLLVAPVLSRATSRKVYLPAGVWVDYWTKQATPGMRWIEVDTPLDVLPLWVRAGAILPMGPKMDYVGQGSLDPLTLEFYAPAASGELVIHDEDMPDCGVRYVLTGDRLDIEVCNPPGEVVIRVYGLDSELSYDLSVSYDA